MKFRAIALSLCLFLIGQPATAQLMNGNVDVTNIKADFPATESATPSMVVWSKPIERIGSRFIRLHFTEIADQSDADYTVTVSDRNGSIVYSYSKDEFKTRSEFWTPLIDSSLVRVDVMAEGRPTGLSFKIGEVAYEKMSGVPFSITVPDDREQIIVYQTEMPQLFDKGRAVAKLTFITNEGSFVCTGFLISDDRMLTNHHCVNTKEVCATTIAIFGYLVGSSGAIEPGKQYQCAEVLQADETLDFALLRLNGRPGSIWGKLELARTGLTENGQLLMVQHPAGETKQVSRKGCNVSVLSGDGNGPGTDFGHKCDTLGGSSGSPMLNTAMKVVGLHHLGFGGGGAWNSQNRAVKMTLIMDKLGL